MKFSTLTPTIRSLLAALCNVPHLTTDKLAAVAHCSPQSVASTLCEMRKMGLIYSMEKGTKPYAAWAANEVGVALFANRPNHTLVYVTDEELVVLQQLAASGNKPALITKFAVVRNFEVDNTGTKKQALLAAEELALRTGQECMVIGLVAQVTPPEQPRAQITLL